MKAAGPAALERRVAQAMRERRSRARRLSQRRGRVDTVVAVRKRYGLDNLVRANAVAQ
jgi:hypothetical protein